jgi:predicted ATPase
MNLGIYLYHGGDLVPSRARLEHAREHYFPRQDRNTAFPYGGIYPRVRCLAYLAHDLWLLGYPDQALQCSQESVTVAKEQGFPYAMAFSQHMCAALHEFRGEEQMVGTLGKEVKKLALEHGFFLWIEHAKVDEGWALIAQGQARDGITLIEEAMSNLEGAGFSLANAIFSISLAKGYAVLGRYQAGLDTIAKAIVLVGKQGCRWPEAELLRLQGELLQMQGAKACEVEACFQQAIDLARQQQAKSWELRSTMNLCRLWQAQGKKAEARQMLGEVYGWFSEGFDTVDLIEAKALLEELS